MHFISDAEEVARQAMNRIAPSLVDPYVALIKFLMNFPEAASKMRGKSAPPVGTKEYIERQAQAFADARERRAPKAPETVPDEMVSVILQDYFGIAVCDLERAKHEHLLSMGAENLVGDLLERYLASLMEPRG